MRQTKGSNPFRDQQSRLIANNGFSRALAKILNLAQQGHTPAEEGREALLVFVPLAVQRTKPARREDWERTWARDTGKTWKQLTEFSDRLRRIAQEIRGLSRSYCFDPKRAFRPNPLLPDNTQWAFAKRQFDKLPTFLEVYACWLEAQVKGISARMKYFYRRAPRRHSGFIHFVSDQVKLMTGNFHDREVADLLNAADRALNPGHQGTEDRFDEQTIALLRSRQKHRAFQKSKPPRS